MKNVYPIIASYYLSEKSKEIIKNSDVGFIDLLGNVYIDLPNIHIEKEGKESKIKEKKKQKSLFSPVSTRIIRTLLLDPEKEWTLKTLSERADVSMGYTHRVVEKLRNELFIERNEDFQIILKDKTRLLDSWRDSYNFNQNKILSFYSFEKEKDKLFKQINRIGSVRNLKYALTLHSGASLIAPFVRYNDVHLYVKSDTEEWIKELDLRPVESGGNFFLVIPYDEGVLQDVQCINDIKIVSNIQLYLDLYNYPTRGREQAEFLRKNKMNF